MTASLHGKVAIVTGVSHDGQVGQAVAKALAAEGASLSVVARTKDNVVARAAELKSAAANVIPIAASLTDEATQRQRSDQHRTRGDEPWVSREGRRASSRIVRSRQRGVGTIHWASRTVGSSCSSRSHIAAPGGPVQSVR